jgi:predicted NBD/HSP70 family sugar kinase
MAQTGTKGSFQKTVNIALVIKTLQERPLISRSDIARLVGIDKSTVTNLVSRLTEYRLVEEVKEGISAPRGGRKPRYLRIPSDAFRVMGVDIRVNGYRVVLVDPAGEVVHRQTISASTAPEKFPTIFQEISKAMKRRCSIEGTVLAGTGCGVPGYTNTETGTVIISRSLGMENYPVRKLSQAAPGTNFLVDNDANCCTWGELHNPGHPPEDLLFLLVRFYPEEYRARTGQTVGIGMGIALNGTVHTGRDYRGGEFRSFKWRNGSKDAVGIETNLLETIEGNGNVRDRFITEVMETISVLTAALRPDNIVIGGDLRIYTDRIRNLIGTGLSDRYIGSRDCRCGIKMSRYGEDDVAAGAALMYLRQLYKVPSPEEIKKGVPGWHTLIPRLERSGLAAPSGMR